MEQLQVSMQLMQGMMAGLPNADGVLGMYEGAAPGPSEMHTAWKLKSYTFPNFGKCGRKQKSHSLSSGMELLLRFHRSTSLFGDGE